ncbi:hypothetical protein JTE90_022670 [Oedothorax gibbosus]|uniref:C2H2-type domain-containing protein n=1 Tax=Oedothorax gibbosus TaxID=931172 RepID=A0AAV6UKD1_9ARAC|nr:hypothetical protein JTE90_022670 [Oedothorax gibbosus]
MSEGPPLPDPPSSGEQEPTMVSVVGSMATWNDDYNSHSPYHLRTGMDADSTSCDDDRMMVEDALRSELTVNAIVAQEGMSADQDGEEDHLSVVDNITAQNFLRESDLMNAASSALGHKGTHTTSEDGEDNDLDEKSNSLHHNLLALQQQSSNSQDHMEMESLLRDHQQDLDNSNYLDNSHASELSVESGSQLDMQDICTNNDIGHGLPEVVPGERVCLSPSSNSSASSLDLPVSMTSGSVGLPPVSTIIRSSAKGRFDVFCRQPNINLIMGIPQYLSNSNSFDVMTSINNIQRLAPGDVPMDVVVSSSEGSTRCIKANSVMSSLGPEIMDKDGLADSIHESDFLPPRTLPSLLMHISSSPNEHLSPTLEEMQKVAEISEHLRSSEGMVSPFDESLSRVMLSSPHFQGKEMPDFSVGENIHHSNYIECLSQRSQPSLVSAIGTNVIMSTSDIDSAPKFTVAEIKALEQQLRTENQNLEDTNHSLDDSGLDSEVIIPDCIETTQSSEIIYSDVQDVLSRSAEDRKILKAQNIVRSTIIEKNLLQQQTQVIKKEPTVITSVENISSLNKIISTKVSQNNNSDIITIRMAGKPISENQHGTMPAVNPSAVTASVIQQLLRVQSPPAKLRTKMQRIPMGVITSAMSSKGGSVVHQNNLVQSASPVNDLVSCKKEDIESGLSVPPNSILQETNLMDNGTHSKDKNISLDISEHSVISHGSKSPPSPEGEKVALSNITTTVLPSLFSSLSASALASLQSSLSSSLPLTIHSALPNICDNSTAPMAPVSPSLSSPPLSPILLPSILRSVSSGDVISNCVTSSTSSLYSGLLKMSGMVKQEPGSGPLPPFTVVSGLSPLLKRSGIHGASPTQQQQIPVVTIKQEPGASRASVVSASEFNPSIILNPAALHLPSSAAAATSAANTDPVPSQASTIAFAGSTTTAAVSSEGGDKAGDKKWSCLMCKNGSPCGLHPGGRPPQPALSGDPAKPFQCTLCGKHLASKNVYQLHLRSHSGEKPFTCNLCGHHFSQKTSLTRHMRSHTGERPFPCEVCGKRFADKERIKIHMRTHTGEKPFACEVCGKRFSQKSTVKRHMSVHTGEKPFKCEACGKGFANRGNLNAHSKTHANT